MPEKSYDHKLIEPKWQKRWDESDFYKVDENPFKPKYYLLEMLPYPSGTLHVGHIRNYTIGDALARYKMMQGFNVLHPMGWDAFGLPAENAAIKNNRHPRDWTMANIALMKRQHRRYGFSYDWSREIATCDPEYYRWNQWFFLKMLERGLAYRKEAMLNWCPQCATVLANEQVVDGCCWRHEDIHVEQRAMQQWFLKITAYADELLADLDQLEGDWPERVITMQRNWIGRSVGTEAVFPVEGAGDKIRIFTTRVDTIYGATCVILAPEHPLVEKLSDEKTIARARQMIDARVGKDAGDIEKDGAPVGAFAVNPYNGERLPIWIANFVLMTYGTGAIMAVPAHDQRDFEFCRKYGIPVRPVIRPVDGELPVESEMEEAAAIYGILENSGEFSGLESVVAQQRMNERAEREGFGQASVTYRIKDWGISRQRYWGTPIPVIHCDACGIVPVPESELPVKLPLDLKIEVVGGSPLARAPEFVNVSCPNCGAGARRETDTMDTFIDSSWYFYRYCDPHNDSAPFDTAKIDYWFPIDQYIGGVEHAILHLIYSRFWTKMMRDLGLNNNAEPAQRLFTQGMVIKDGFKMSKSKGNVVSADGIAESHGTDTARMFGLFAAPPEKDLDWLDAGVDGIHRFLSRVYRFVTRNADLARGEATGSADADRQALRKLHQVVRKTTEDFDTRWHFNTSIAAVMELMNLLGSVESQLSSKATREILDTLVLLLGPFAPYLAEELWEELGHEGPVFYQKWPRFDPELARDDEIEVVLQVKGKVRSRMTVPAGISRDELERRALADNRIQELIAGKQVVKVIAVPDKLVNIVMR